jgi:hypothetical protein
VGAALAAGAFGFAAIATITSIGVGYVASRIIGGSVRSGAGQADPTASQGARVQLPPATNNKIPVLYGRGFINGAIVDARLISTDQKTNNVMYYNVVLSETCNVAGATYTVNDIYWNDLRLIAETTAGNQHKILKGVKKVDGPGEDFEDTNFKKDSNHRVQIRVYAGNSTAAQQIWPAPATSNQQNAWEFWPDNDWTNANQMQGLVFAVIRLEFDQENGFTNLPPVTFDITNSISNPALVWQDYMTSTRYGAGLFAEDLNLTAVTAWQNFCDEQITYTSISGSTPLQKRYEINGPIDTNRSVKDNIDSILRNGGAWMSYDTNEAQWRPIIKKAITAGDPSVVDTHFTASVVPGNGSNGVPIGDGLMTVTAFPEGRLEAGQLIVGSIAANTTVVNQITPLIAGETFGQKGRYRITTSTNLTNQKFYATASGLLEFNDENIISGIALSSTRLDDLYNIYEVEFFDKFNKDQRAYARDSLPTAARNPQEPDNTLSFGLDLCNNSVQAMLIGGMELRQSRDDLAVEFTSSHYGIQAQAGDIIAITNNIYGWAPKLFRVTRIKETETEEGLLLANIQALEYNGDVYTIESLAEFTTEANIGIPPQVASGNLVTPDDNGVVVTDINDNVAVPNIVIGVEIPATGGPYDEIQVWYATGPTTPGFPGDNEYRWIQSSKPPGNEPIFKGVRTIKGTSITGGNTINTSVAHGLLAGDAVMYKEANAYGLLQDRLYYVLDAGLTSTAFRLGLQENGNAIALTNSIGLDLDLNTAYPITIITLPGNAPGQQYYFRVRVGLRGFYSGYTNPDTARLVVAEFTPNPVGGGKLDDLEDVVITNPAMGDLLYYNGIAWVNDNVIASTAPDQRMVLEYQDDSVGINSSLFLRKDYTTGTYVNNDGTAIAYQIDSDTQDLNQYGLLAFAWHDENPEFTIFASTDSFATPAQRLLRTNNVRTEFYDSVLYIDNNTNKVGINTNAPDKALHVIGDIAQSGENLYINYDNSSNNTTLHFNGSKNLTWVNTSGQERFELNDSLVINRTTPFLTFSTQPDGVNAMYGIRGASTVDDPWFVGAGSTGDDLGYLEIATGDNRGGLNNGGQIYVRQYSGASPLNGVPWFGGNGTIQTELTLLDNLGHTVIPNNLTVDSGTLFVDSANNRVGINKLTPAYPLDVVGNTFITGTLETTAKITSGGDVRINGNNIRASDDEINITLDSKNKTIFSGHIEFGNNITGTMPYLKANGTGEWMIKSTNGTDAILIDDDGTVVIQQDFIFNKDLMVNGDFECEWEARIRYVDDPLASQLGSQIVLNYNVPTSTSQPLDARIIVDRAGGTPARRDVMIKWNETDDRWQYTTNGTTFLNFPNQNVDTNSDVTVNDLTINGTLTYSGTSVTTFGNIGVNGGDIYSTATTFNLLNKDDAGSGTNNGPATVNAFLGATEINIGATTGTTTINNDLVVPDSITSGPIVRVGKSYTAMSSSANQVIDSWSVNTYRSARYTLQVAWQFDGTGPQNYYQMVDLMITTKGDGTDAYITVFGDLAGGTSGALAQLGIFSTDVSSGLVRLLGSPATTGFTKWTVMIDATYFKPGT